VKARDVRGFVYALDPLRGQREWALEAARIELARLQAESREMKAERDRLVAGCDEQSAQASKAWTTRSDPATHAQRLASMAVLHARRSAIDVQLGELAQRIDLVRRKCIECTHRLDVLDQHRADALVHFRAQLSRRQAVAADDEWSMRAQAREEQT